MKRNIGYIDSRKLKVGSAGLFAPASLPVIPGQEVHATLEDFIGVPAVAANGPVYLGSGVWTFREQVAGLLDQGNVVGGVVTLAGTGGDNDSAQITHGVTAAMAAFFPAAGKNIYFKTRFMSTNLGVGMINLFIGLIVPVAAAILADDGAVLANPNWIGLVVRDVHPGGGVVNYRFAGDLAGAQVYNDLGVALATGVYHTIEFVIEGVTRARVAIDGVEVLAAAILAANLPVLGLMPAIAIKAGSAAAEILTVDYLNCIQLR